MAIFTVTIKNWDKFNPRSDVKSCSWFRMSNDFFSDPDFYGASLEARATWIFILGVASKKMSATIRVNDQMLADSLRIPLKTALVALSELASLGCMEVSVSDVNSTRSDPIVLPMFPSATNERTDERTNEHIGSLDVPTSAAVIAEINRVCDRNFRNTPANARHINARITEGYALADFTRVCEFKHAQWGDDPKMRGYLRPETLFGSKFDSYLQEARATRSRDDVDAELIRILEGKGA